MSSIMFDFLSMEFYHPSCREAGPHAMEFTRRGVINILPRGFAHKDDRAVYQRFGLGARALPLEIICIVFVPFNFM